MTLSWGSCTWGSNCATELTSRLSVTCWAFWGQRNKHMCTVLACRGHEEFKPELGKHVAPHFNNILTSFWKNLCTTFQQLVSASIIPNVLMATWAWFTRKCKWVNFVVEFNFLFLCRNIHETEYIAILLQSIKICLSEWKQSILTWLFPQARGLGGREDQSDKMERWRQIRSNQGPNRVRHYPKAFQELLAIAASLWLDPMGFTWMKRLGLFY